ncbi:hypothetical protein KUCAC02_027168 [Chaenocephalus aceratus]|uniref:Uncharacterized protein n=1 Tax=Chaenocephalus aceratus TaxID=36190 RepID=A0ACB9W2S9_CHAAC|nr:hypothetical protein KUCAC02_027168 [Chaenocephalus aceratus]
MCPSHSPPPYVSCAGREEDKLDPTGAGTSEVGMASRWGRCSPDCSRNPQDHTSAETGLDCCPKENKGL